MLKLIPIPGSTLSAEIVVDQLPITLGRGDEATICVNDRWASRVHCEIDKAGASLVVRDLDSKHGTIVNGSTILEAALEAGDLLTVGLHSFAVEVATEIANHSSAVSAPANPR